VVATRGGGIEELVTDGLNGCLVDSGAAAAMAQKIELLLNDATTGRRLGSEGLRHIKADFTVERMTGSYISLYGHLLKDKQGTFVK
jgi:glycosyltransferase involved in cell wall biosynthesis